MTIGSKAENAIKVDIGRSPLANTAMGAIGGALGAAGVSATLPVILPFFLVGGLVGYLVTNGIPRD